MRQRTVAADAARRPTARRAGGRRRQRPHRRVAGSEGQCRAAPGDPSRQRRADQPVGCQRAAAVAGQQRPGQLQLRGRVAARGGQGDPRRHARPELQHRARRAGHGDDRHPEAGGVGRGAQPAGRRACAEQRAHGLQRWPLQHRARRPGPGQRRGPAHRFAGDGARLRVAGGAAALRLGRRDGEDPQAVRQAGRDRQRRWRAQHHHRGRHPRRARELPAHRACRWMPPTR